MPYDSCKFYTRMIAVTHVEWNLVLYWEFYLALLVQLTGWQG
jgi:hypothetical protein